ncbi:MAG: effector-associated domain EAD1-containing protein [Paludibacter sp.]|nr:effector-associated domain EAD1-containing protein [Paludibacter sp.]
MEIEINQILCGEDEKGGWGLIKTTFNDVGLAKRIAFYTDIQDQIGGLHWKPTVRGFMCEDYFLIMKTFPDKSLEVRPGRVFSHVFAISRANLINVVDLYAIFDFLPKKLNKNCSIDIIKIDSKTCVEQDSSKSFLNRFNKVIHGFVSILNYGNTIIWVGDEDYELAISKYWQILSIEEKEKLNFGIYFNLDSVLKEKLNLITIPENIESKFISGGFCLIRKTDTYILTEIYEQLLAGDSNARQRINKFEKALETNKLSKDEINKVGIVLNTFENIDSIIDIKKINSLSQVIAKYSPDKQKGIRFKNIVLDKICKLITSCEISELNLVRNFKTESFENSENQLRVAINIWLDKYLFTEAETSRINFFPIFEKINDSNKDSWWSRNIQSQLINFLSKITVKEATIIFNWLRFDFSILGSIETFIDKSTDSENCFVSQLANSYKKSQFKGLIIFAIERNWLKFHAKLMILEYPFEKALKEQLVFDKQQDFNGGIKIIIEGIPPCSIISFTIINGDKRLINLCGEYCHKDYSLLNNIDVSNFYWQEIWVCAINQGNKLNDGVLNPIEKVFQLFDLIIDGKEYNKDLIEKISESEYGNILDYQRRDILWQKLSLKSKKGFLEKTSSKLLELLSINSTYIVPDDKILSDYIISNGISTFLYYNRNKVRYVLPIFSKYSQLPERILKDYVYNHSQSIDATDAVQLGRLVHSRRYNSVATTIYNKSSKYNNWKFALEECHQLLDFVTRAALAFSGIIANVKIPTDEWWKSTEDIIVDLYPNGQAIKTIWNNAGGKESDLLINSTGVEVWHDLLTKLRRGFFKDITMNSLLKEIKKNYYDSNERFKLIYNLRKNYIN